MLRPFATSRKKTLLWCVFGVSIISLTFWYHVQQSLEMGFIEKHHFVHYDLQKEEPLQLEQKCQIPRFHPFDPSILSYLSPPRSIKCKERFEDLTFVDNEGILKFNLSTVKLYGYKVEDLNCDYQEIIRKNDFAVEYSEAQKIRINGSQLTSDFVYVSCYNFANIAFYSNIHCHIKPKRKFLNMWENITRNNVYNILIFGIDSLSRLSAIRSLPKTYNFLTKDLKAFVFRGMTKVGDNTFPNLVAILTGKSVHGNELPKINNSEQTYDIWPLLWKNFSAAGYITLFAEDRPDIGLFNYFRGGLQDPPTDHYLRPFWLAVQSSKRHRLSSNLCFGNIPKHLLQLKYISNFIEKYSNAKQPFFAFSFLVELSHDYISEVTAADKDLESWLKDLLRLKYLKNTFLFFLSDHGHRFDAMRATLIGRIEERMPLFALVVPESFLKTRNENLMVNLRKNQERLVTPFDIYFTIMDILSFSMRNSQLGYFTSSRGTTLFNQITINRTCDTAGIPEHYCVCEVEKPLETNDPRTQKAAKVLIATINQFLNSTGHICKKLSLKEILRADLLLAPRGVTVNSRIYFGNQREDGAAEGMVRKLRILIKTIPGLGLFESTLLFRDKDEKVSVLGDVSRINEYKEQSSCIDDPILKKYCFCAF